MKTLIAFILLCMSSLALAFDACLTDAYYDPANPGEGLILLTTDEGAAGWFYTYGTDATHRWYVVVFDNDGLGTMYSTKPANAGEFVVGGALLEVFADSIKFTYAVQYDLEEGYLCMSVYCSGELDYVRLIDPCGE